MGGIAGFSRLVENVAAFCREHPLDEKVLVVPSRIVGRQIADSVARTLAPGGWINLRVETVGSLAHSIVGEELAAQGRSTLSLAQRLAIVEKVCADVLGDASYFGPLRSSPAFHRALSRTIDEVRSAGILPASIASGSLEDGRKAEDLKRILQAYDRELGARFADGPGILRRAILLTGKEAAARGAWFLVPGLDGLSAPEREFLGGVSGDRLVPVAADEPDRWHRPTNRYCFFRAVGEENEIREIFRRTRAERIPFDDIEVLYTDRAAYLSLAYELSQQYRVPATFVDRIDVAYTRPGQAVLGFLNWLMSDFGERELRRLIRSGALDLEELSGSASLSAASAARILRKARIGWGSGRYDPCLRAYAGRLEESGDDPDSAEPRDPEAERKEAADAGAVRRLASRLLAASPVRSNRETVTLATLARACAAFAGRYGRSASELDGMASSALPGILDDLAFLGEAPLGLIEAASRVRDAVAELFVGGSSVTYPQPGRIHFAGIEDGGHTGRRHTFVIGLDESRHPGAGLQDPVLLDGERRRLNTALAPSELRMRGESPRERTRALLTTLARLRGNVTFSFSCHDLAEDRELFPAAALLDVFRTATESPEGDPAALVEAAGDPAGYFGSVAPLDGSEWWLTALRASGRPASGVGAVRAAYPWVGQGAAAVEARRGPRFTKWDGLVGSAGTALDPRESEEIVSATRLQTLSDCPFAYFVRYVLGVDAPDEMERDPWNWLQPKDLGSLLHEDFQHFIQRRGKPARSGPTHELELAGIVAIADETIERWRQDIPPPDEAALERQRLDIRRSCETFLRSESREAASLTPVHFEIPFGIGSSDSVTIPLGRGRSIRVRGVIDRVDLAGEGSYEVWDYKTGSNFGYDPGRGLDGGRRLQHALYAAAFEEILKRSGKPGAVTKAGYIFTGPRGDGRREDFGFDRAALEKVLRDLCDLLSEGFFPHGHDPRKCCAFCPYGSVCGGKETACSSSRRKFECAENARLAKLFAPGDVEEP